MDLLKIASTEFQRDEYLNLIIQMVDTANFFRNMPKQYLCEFFAYPYTEDNEQINKLWKLCNK